MNIKKIVFVLIFSSLLGCTQDNDALHEAISLSREGLALIQQANDKKLTQEESNKHLRDGVEKINQSKNIYRDLISNSPDNGLYLNNYGWLQMKTGDLKGAKNSFDLALQHKDSIEPKDALDKNIQALNILLNP